MEKTAGIIVGEDNRPKVVCPHCRQIIVMDIKLFMNDVTKVVESNCPKCNGKVFTGLLILVNSNIKNLYGAIQLCIDAIDPKDKLYRGGN